MTVIDWVIVACYLVIIVLIGLAGLKKVKTGRDFAVAGSSLPVGIVTATLAASYIGGSFAIGAAGATFREGYTYFFALLGFPLATIAVGIWVAPRLRRYAAETVGDVMEHHYGVVARVFTGLISMVVCAAILGAQIRALGTILEVFTGIDFTVGAIVLTLIVIVYSTAGGLWSDVRADVIHFAVLAVAIPIAILVAIRSVGTPAEIVASVPPEFFTITGDKPIGFFISLFIGFVFGETLIQPYSQRAFAGANTKTVRKAFIYAGIFGIVFLFTTSSGGILARALDPTIPSDAAMPELINRVIPAGFTGLLVAGFIAIIMSSASSFLNSTTVVVVRDLWTLGGRRKIEDHTRLRFQRVMNLVIGVIALVVGLSFPNIIDILMVYFSTWAPTVIVPLLLGVLFDVRHRLAGPIAMVAGLLATWLWNGPLGEPFGILGLAVGLVTNLIVFFLVVALTPKTGMAPRGFDIVAPDTAAVETVWDETSGVSDDSDAAGDAAPATATKEG